MKTKMVTQLAYAILLRKQVICETIIDQLNPEIIGVNRTFTASKPEELFIKLFSALIANNSTKKIPA